MLTTATTPAVSIGNCRSPAVSRSAAVSGMSVAAKVTSLFWTCLVPSARRSADSSPRCGLLLVGFGPLRIDRIGKGGAGAGNIGGRRGRNHGRRSHAGCRQRTENPQSPLLPCPSDVSKSAEDQPASRVVPATALTCVCPGRSAAWSEAGGSALRAARTGSVMRCRSGPSGTQALDQSFNAPPP